MYICIYYSGDLVEPKPQIECRITKLHLKKKKKQKEKTIKNNNKRGYE